MVGMKMTATVFLNSNVVARQPLPVGTLPLLTCRATLMQTSQVMVCDVLEDSDSEKILASFIPPVGGEYRLQMTSEYASITDYCVPFHVLPSPETRTGPVKTITGLAKPMGVAVNENRLIAVIENGAHSITLIDTDERRAFFGSKLSNPRGVAFSSDGHILVTDDHRLQKFTIIGKHFMSFGSSKKGSGPQQFNTPMGVAIHPITGEIYVADCYNHRIQVIAADFSQSRSFGAKGSAVGQFKYPTDVCFSPAGLLYISNSSNRCIEVYSSTDEPIGLFGHRSSVTGCSGELNNPQSLVIDPHDNIYITETHSSVEKVNSFNDSRISCYRADGEFLRHVGRRGNREGEFDDPSGIAMDKLGNLYICDTNNGRLVIM